MKLLVLDPQNDYRLIEYVNLKQIEGCPIFNFYSLLDRGLILDRLKPDMITMQLLRDSQYGDGDSFEFDRVYANQLLSYKHSFMALMYMLSNIENSEDIILLSNYNNRVVMPILDSLLKLIQERYGIDHFIANTIEDIDELEKSHFESVEKRNVFYMDLERYKELVRKFQESERDPYGLDFE